MPTPGKGQYTPDDAIVESSRFRPFYRPLTETEKALIDNIKNKAEELEALYFSATIGGGRYRSLALTDLESSVMWIVKEFTG